MQTPRNELPQVTHAKSARAFAEHTASKRQEQRERRHSAASTHTCWHGVSPKQKPGAHREN